MKVAITGSIACGKSTITNYLLKKGYQVIDADKIGHHILLDDEVKHKIKILFTTKVFTNGEIDRQKLGNMVFEDKEKLSLLNHITHSKIKKKIKDLLADYRGLVFLDVALLYEANFTDLVDKVIVVHTNYDNQLTRLMKRNNLSKQEAIARIDKQMSSDEKVLLADFVVDNNGTKENSIMQMEAILESLKGEILC